MGFTLFPHMNIAVKFANKDKSEFFPYLKKKVETYFKDNHLSKTSEKQMLVKTLCMLGLYFVPYALMLSGFFTVWQMLLLAAVMGLGKAGIGLAVMHDANHNAYSSRPLINTLVSYSMNLIGGSSFTWKIQHNVLHHTYTNIYEIDEDIEDKPFLRLSPHGKLKPMHRYQHIYAVFLYALMTLSWIAGKKDFSQTALYNRNGLTQKHGFDPKREKIILWATKIFYAFYILLIPMLVLNISIWQWLLGFVVMHAVTGVLLTLIFQLAHVVEETQHPAPNSEGMIEHGWAIHELYTTANFARKNRFLTWFVGGLNHQIEHHLFPQISHIHYPALSKIVQQTAYEFDLPYNDHRTFGGAVASHLRTLRKLGRNEPF
jgi:linoleoyl-CoA desaturase